MSTKFWMICGAMICALSVAMGAFTAHALKGSLGEYELSIIETGARYQMYHGLAILIATVFFSSKLMPNINSNAANQPNVFFLVGVILFSGSLYMLAMFDLRWVVYLTPLGGICLLIGWLLVVIKVMKIKHLN